MKEFYSNDTFEIEGRGTVFVFGETFPENIRRNDIVLINRQTYQIRDVKLRRSGLDGSVVKGFALLVTLLTDTAPTDPPLPPTSSTGVPA